VTKVLVLYYSSYGHIKTVANAVAKALAGRARRSMSSALRRPFPRLSRRLALLVEHNHADSEHGAADIISTLVGSSKAARIIGSLACSIEFRISYRRTGRCVLFFRIVAKKIMASLPRFVLG
jgi:hypothetical protein